MNNNFRTHFIAGAKFSRPCGLGLVADPIVTSLQAHTLGLIISECLCKIYPPQFLLVANKLGISDSQVPSLGDLGILIHAEVSIEHGVRILFSLPNWIKKFEKGVCFSFSLQFASALRAFVDQYAPEHKWLSKFSVNNYKFISSVEQDLGIRLDYSANWLTTDGIEKLSYLKFQILSESEDIQESFQETYTLIEQLLEQANQFNFGLQNLLDVNDGTIVPRIGYNKRSIDTTNEYEF